MRANDPARGVIHAASGDIHNWVTVENLLPARADIVTALAYLDVADTVSDQRFTALSSHLQTLMASVGQLSQAMSAAQLGLTANIVTLQREPGFEHEQVVSISPPAGALVPRGSVVEVRVNFEG